MERLLCQPFGAIKQMTLREFRTHVLVAIYWQAKLNEVPGE